MKAVTETHITDSNDAIILLVFENDEERIRVANQILNTVFKEGKRGYAIYPEGLGDRVKDIAHKFI